MELFQLYSNLTYEEIWKVRNECLDVLKSINVRMTILLRLGLQNENATFNIGKQTYNERYDQQKAKVAHLKLTDVNCDKSTYGSIHTVITFRKSRFNSFHAGRHEKTLRQISTFS